DCSGIDPNTGCVPSGDGYSCRFQFQISLTPESAARQASVTSQIPIQPDGQYLTEPLILFLDDEEVDSLQISTGLRGRAETDISISGSGAGASQELAIEDTLKNMKRLQTILITGSLPVKLNVVQTKSLSASLGEEFLRNALWMGLVSVAIVALILFVRYRRFIVSLPVLACMLMEVFLTLGFAALFRWNMDLSSIAGLIVTVGTGVHDQLVITDELLEGGAAEISSNWKDKIKSAFGIVFTAYGAIMVAMIPLLFASAGLLKGFALTTMAGVSFGVFITRPAFAKFIEVMLKR
ncbi:MAG TPA: MMPL family transporter, partial [Candidatus Nanoarchaeia archaeon]|nr:MMPL family transporter [Candidatus Nanoarchaeia archaeon]